MVFYLEDSSYYKTLITVVFSLLIIPTGIQGQIGNGVTKNKTSTSGNPTSILGLSIVPDSQSNDIRMRGNGPDNLHYDLLGSSNLQNWTLDAEIHHTPFEYKTPNPKASPKRFFRLESRPLNSRDVSKNLIRFNRDAFLSPQIGFSNSESRWIKFSIRTSNLNEVIYQDSRKFVFHYDFITKNIAEFRNIPPEEFETLSLYPENQTIITGAVVFPPDPNLRQAGIQLVGRSPYPEEMVAKLFRRIESTINSESPVHVFYMPTFEQIESTHDNHQFFTDKGISIGSSDQWITGNVCYSFGWAMGLLHYSAPENIESDFASGALRPDDILLTDGIPAEIPNVAGVISLTSSTPNSHVAILARTFGIPFVYLRNPDMLAQLEDLKNQEVILTANPLAGFSINANSCDIRLFPLTGSMPPELKTQILELKQPGKLVFAAKQKAGFLFKSTDELTPSDIAFFGGKAANFGILRRSIPDNSPRAIAFSFDLWDEFMDQSTDDNLTLRQIIRSRLEPFSYPPESIAQLKNTLKGIRDFIRDQAQFTSSQQISVIEALGQFDPNQKIRFRSSTNVEDSDQFSGAGLYDSYSGCLVDDQDDDREGPSHCDPGKLEERGVFRAIKKVYASFYNDNAYLERLRFGVDEAKVGMALLVHHSFPDEIELANGVATLTRNRSSRKTVLVTQRGAVSVANPSGNSQPETVNITRFSFGDFTDLVQSSNLVLLGDHVMDWEKDYLNLADLLFKASQAWEIQSRNLESYTLDFEYKKIKPTGLVIKQIRQIPDNTQRQSTSLFLLNNPILLETQQGERDDLFAVHRLKSRLRLESSNTLLNRRALASGLITDMQIQLNSKGERVAFNGPPSTFPESNHTTDTQSTSDFWTMELENQSTRMELSIQNIPLEQTNGGVPITTLNDLRFSLSARYDNPVLSLDPGGELKWISEESIRLSIPESGDEPDPSDLLQIREFNSESGVSVQSEFYWPPAPTGPTAGYTAPLKRWKKTRIEGLTSKPIELTGYYSQSYQPGHHNFWETFLFEPQLEPEMNPLILQELQEINIRYIHFFYEDDRTRLKVTIIGFDNQITDVP
jgi:hypothetical protein